MAKHVAEHLDDFILQTHGLSRSFGGFHAVKGVNLNVRRHGIHALIGPNGAGKSTCFNLLTKFIAPTAGTIVYNGTDITALSPTIIARKGLVRSFQISAVFGQLSVLDNVRLALQRKMGLELRFWAPLSRLNSLNARAAEILDDVGLGSFLDARANELSYGRKRALEIATTIAMDPEMMLLDEPTSGLGTEDIDRVVSLIGKAAKGRTVVMVEHNLGVVAGLCDRVTVLQRGQILAEGDYAEIANDARVIEAYVGGEDE